MHDDAFPILVSVALSCLLMGMGADVLWAVACLGAVIVAAFLVALVDDAAPPA